MNFFFEKDTLQKKSKSSKRLIILKDALMKSNLSYKLLLIGLMVIFAVATGLTHAFAQEPPVITSFTATATSSSQADLSWSASGEGISRYLLYNYETSTYIYDGPNKSFSHTGLSLDTTVYTYAVWAYNDAGWSAQANASVTLLTVPVITSFTAIAVSSSQIDLTWSPSGEGIDGYLLWNWEKNSYIYSGTAKNFSHSGLNADTLYQYVVWAHNIVGWSSQADTSATTLAIPDTVPPGSITDLSVSSVRVNSVDLTWTAPGDDGNTGTATSYDVRYSTSPITEENWASATPANIPEALLPSLSGTLEVAGLIGLGPGTTYYFAIKTKDDVGNESSLSNVVSATTLETILSIDNAEAKHYQSVTIPVMIYNSPGIGAVGINIIYDPSVVLITNAAQGDFSSFFGFDNSNASNGKVTINTFVIGDGLVGDLKVADITLEALGNIGDSCSLTIEIIVVSDQFANDVPVTINNGMFTIIDSDSTAPTSSITAPIDGSTIHTSKYIIQGTSDDGTGSGVQKVEVSTDGGSTWNLATGTTSWSYEWTISSDGTYVIKSRATDNAGNTEVPGAGVTVTVIKADVFVDPSTKTVNQGETFDINVVIDPHGISISGAQADIAFDPAILQVNSITEGNLFKQNGASTFFFISKGIDNLLGTAGSVVCAILGPHSVSTKGTFFIINATAIGSGTSGIDLSNVKIADPDANPVLLSTTNGSVTVLSNTQPDLSANPTSVNFGSLNIGKSSIRTVTVTNTGTADLEIGAIEITDIDASEFSILNDSCSGQTIAPLGTCTLQVRFKPESGIQSERFSMVEYFRQSISLLTPGTYKQKKSATLNIPSNDPDTPVLEVQLTGKGYSSMMQRILDLQKFWQRSLFPSGGN